MSRRQKSRNLRRFYFTSIAFRIAIIVLTASHLFDLDLFEQLDEFLRAYEAWELDEIVPVLFLFLIAIGIDYYRSAWRRLKAANTSLTLANDQLAQANYLKTKFLMVSKQTAAKLQKTNEELIRVTHLKDEFLANMSHELRTPLNAVLGMAEGLQEGVFGQINKEQSKALETIERSGSHLLELINDILDIAKIESGQIELDINSTDVVSLCRSSLAFIKQRALKKRIQVELQKSSDLPDFCMDERRIRQVLINLLDNAVKFTPEGGRITLEVSCPQYAVASAVIHSPSPILRIAVVDTGIGIAADAIEILFQPFVQIDSALNRQYQGTGLGLALVKHIVELHGGKVGITSKLGVGSRFVIDLPCAICSSSSTHHSGPGIDPDQAAQPAIPLTASPLILIAEDNEANISTVSNYLVAKGYRILLAKNGQEAISLAQAKHPDLILMDIQMPGMDGLEAAQEIRRNPNLTSVPIVALTALAMNEDRDRCLAAGAKEYLSKPVKMKQLATLIQQLLATRSR